MLSKLNCLNPINRPQHAKTQYCCKSQEGDGTDHLDPANPPNLGYSQFAA